MPGKTYKAIKQHISEYPDPITLSKGDNITIGEEYQGPEGWDNWYLCSAEGQKDGWVPGQVIEKTSEKTGIAKEAYTARELNINEGDTLTGSRTLNGWLWCTRLSDRAEGWVPLENLQEIIPQT